jgi:hypothetical protein
LYLLRTETGWQVVGRLGGSAGQQVTHYFDREDDARAMLRRMLDTTPAPFANWAKMTCHRRNAEPIPANGSAVASTDVDWRMAWISRLAGRYRRWEARTLDRTAGWSRISTVHGWIVQTWKALT